jgi:hypothetical protein
MWSTVLKIPNRILPTANRQNTLASYSAGTTGGYHKPSAYNKPSGYHKASNSVWLMVTKKLMVIICYTKFNTEHDLVASCTYVFFMIMKINGQYFLPIVVTD